QERPLKAGEIVLGYPDETGEVPPMPTPDVLGRNGTYAVFRKLHTKVAAYRQYLRAKAASREAEALLGAKMVGRWQSGAPLAVAPEVDDPELGADPLRNNDFLYGDDPRGLKCPVGSHARRAGWRSSTRDRPLESARLRRSFGRRRGAGVARPPGAPLGRPYRADHAQPATRRQRDHDRDGRSPDPDRRVDRGPPRSAGRR